MITHQALTSFIKVHAGTTKARLGLYGLTALESILFPIPVDPPVMITFLFFILIFIIAPN